MEQHAFECWAPRDGTCRVRCSCQCHYNAPDLDDMLTFKVRVMNLEAETAIGNMFADHNFIDYERVSSLVFYCNMTGREAISLMERNPDFEIVRAPSDWSI